jgi:hypothetical protein
MPSGRDAPGGGAACSFAPRPERADRAAARAADLALFDVIAAEMSGAPALLFRRSSEVRTMNARRSLSVFFAIAASSAFAAACSGGTGSTGQTSSAALDFCVLDGAVCVDLPDVNIPPLPFDGGLPSFDANLPPLPDGGFSLPDVNVPPFPEAGFPQLPDGGFSFDAGAGECNPVDPKYSDEYAKEVVSGQVTPCGSGCPASQCCFFYLSCVPQ